MSNLQLKRKHKFLATVQGAPWVLCFTSRGTPTSSMQLEQNRKFPTSAQEEDRLPCCYSIETPCSPLELKMSTKPPEAPWEDSQDHHCNSRATMRIQLNLREALFPITRTVPGNKDKNSPTRRGSPHHNESGVPRTSHLKRSQFSSVQSLSRVRLLATSLTAAHQAPPSMGFSRQEYWSGLDEDDQVTELYSAEWNQDALEI